MEQNRIHVLHVLSMLYITLSIVCNPLFFRYLEFYDFRISCSALVYPLVYVLLDTMTALSDRKTVIVIIVAGRICDGLFSILLFSFANSQIPLNMSDIAIQNTNAVNTIGNLVWPLWYHGAIAATVTAIAEILLFAFLFKKINNFFLSTIASIIIMLLTHNVITDYPLLKNDPQVWRIIFGNLSINISIMVLYAGLISILMKAKLIRLYK